MGTRLASPSILQRVVTCTSQTRRTTKWRSSPNCSSRSVLLVTQTKKKVRECRLHLPVFLCVVAPVSIMLCEDAWVDGLTGADMHTQLLTMWPRRPRTCCQSSLSILHCMHAVNQCVEDSDMHCTCIVRSCTYCTLLCLTASPFHMCVIWCVICVGARVHACMGVFCLFACVQELTRISLITSGALGLTRLGLLCT